MKRGANNELRALFPAGVDPWAWLLPSGNTIEQASATELLAVRRILGTFVFR